MDKKGKNEGLFLRVKSALKVIKQSYLCKLASKFLSVICSIVLVVLLIIGGLMFFFNMKSKAYHNKGMEYTSPFGLYTIISGSMEPNIDVYDVVLAADTDISKIKVGDVITFVSNWSLNYGVTVTHRVIEVSKTENGEFQLTTKGDNNQSPDGGYVTQRNLIGKVIGRLPQLGQLQFFLATKIGWFLVVFIPALMVIISDSIKIFKLCFLKNQINNVKTSNEAMEEKQAEQKQKKRKDVKKVSNEIFKNTINNKKEITKKLPIVTSSQQSKNLNNMIELPLNDNKNNEIERKIPDLNIDTTPLPKIDNNGKIKENSSELPIVNNANKNFTNNLTQSTLPLIKKTNIQNRDNQNIRKKPLSRR